MVKGEFSLTLKGKKKKEFYISFKCLKKKCVSEAWNFSAIMGRYLY